MISRSEMSRLLALALCLSWSVQASAQFPACGNGARPSAAEHEQACRPLPRDMHLYEKRNQDQEKILACQHASPWIPSQDEFEAMLAVHEQFLEDPDTGARADFCGADLRGLELDHLRPLRLSRAIFSSSQLDGLNLADSDFSGAGFCSASLRGTRFDRANASHASFWYAHAQAAEFVKTSLCTAGFSGAMLQNTNFWDSNLRAARLTGVEVEGTRLIHVNLAQASYQPLMGTPEAYLGNTVGLIQMNRASYPRGLNQLRTLANESGNPEQVREISAAMARFRARGDLNIEQASDVFRAATAWLFIAFIGIPTNWGLSLWIPFALLILVFASFWAIYYRHLRKGGERLVIIRPEGRLVESEGKYHQAMEPEVATMDNPRRRAAAKYALLYGLQATFFFVADSLKVSNWVNRLNPDEERVAGIGLMRSLGGLQSVLSLYLIGLWVAASFGNLFSG